MLDENEQGKRQRSGLRVTIGAGIVLLVLAAAAAVVVAMFTPRGVHQVASRPTAVTTESPTKANSPKAFVHVVGEVNSPGLYELRAGDRIVDAVAAAGGFTAAADQSGLNLAQVVTDGEQVVVAKIGAVPVAPGASASGKVDINKADATALETLDGVGPALAQRILDYRKAHGGFSSINDLQNVSGIGDKKFAAMKDKVST
jgi:competence protein ComEA